MKRGLRRSVVALVAVVSVVVGACGGDDAEPSGAGNGGESVAAGEPMRGGTITFGTFSEAQSVDPVRVSGGGATGNIELAAVYDTLVRYNPDSLEFEMRTAESVEPNDDYSEWTVKIRPGIEFGDGTSYDAAALALSIERHQSPDNLTNSRALTAIIESVEIVDELTVRFTLSEPWTGFPFILADRPGMLVSPAALERYGEDFGTPSAHEGAGAGAFEIDSFRPAEALVLKRREDYWAGEAYLDSVRFVNFGGGERTLAAFESDNVDIIFLREPQLVAKALEAGYPNFTRPVQTGAMLGFKNRAAYTCSNGEPKAVCADQPDGVVRVPSATSELRLRQAIAAAIDPRVFSERVYDGALEGSLSLLQPSFAWDPGVPGPKTDSERARQLVAELKAEGWDGKLMLTCSNTPEYTRFAQAIATMLQAVGIEIENNSAHDLPTQIREVAVTKNFDLSCFSLNLPSDEGAIVPLALAFGSAGSLRWGYSSTEMDEAIRAVRVAVTDEEKRAAWRQVATVWDADQPGVPLGAIHESVVWNEKLHGVVPTQQSVVLLHEAWVER